MKHSKKSYTVICYPLLFTQPRLESQRFYFDDDTWIEQGRIEDFISTEGLEFWTNYHGSDAKIELNGELNLLVTLHDDDGESGWPYMVYSLIPFIDSYFHVESTFFIFSGTNLSSPSNIKFGDPKYFSPGPIFKGSLHIHHDPEFLRANRAIENPHFYENWRLLVDRIANGIRNKNLGEPLTEAYRSFHEAFTTSQQEFKIPHLIRALEALVISKNAKDFAFKICSVPELTADYPAELFKDKYKPKEQIRVIISSLYELRSCLVHGKSFRESFSTAFDAESDDEIVARFEFLAEWITRKTIMYFIKTEYIPIVSSRESLRVFWDRNLTTRRITFEATIVLKYRGDKKPRKPEKIFVAVESNNRMLLLFTGDHGWYEMTIAGDKQRGFYRSINGSTWGKIRENTYFGELIDSDDRVAEMRFEILSNS